MTVSTELVCSARTYKCQPHLEGFAIEYNPPYSGSNNIKKLYKCRSSEAEQKYGFLI